MPLLCALENKASVEVVRFLVEKDPECLHLEQYKLGKTPLHVAASNGADVSVVQYLLSKKPETIAEKDAWGKTPLACACAAATDTNDGNEEGEYCVETNTAAVLEVLMDPARIVEPDRGGMLPLHIACAAGASIENIELLMDEYPDAIRVPDNNGRYPLHAACSKTTVSEELLEMLVTAYPDALRTFDKMGAVPLHIAIQRKASSEAILYLIQVEQGAVRTREASTRMYPLHLACRYGADMTILEKLIEIYPVAIDAVDGKGNTIFHLACNDRLLTVELAEWLLDKTSEDTIRMVNEEQSLPLHLAVHHRSPMPVLQLLIDHYPEALICKDKAGNVPLHKAFQNWTAVPVLVRLAQENHRALSKKNKRGRTPEACANPIVLKSFRRARMWFIMKKAFCPFCIREKT